MPRNNLIERIVFLFSGEMILKKPECFVRRIILPMDNIYKCVMSGMLLKMERWCVNPGSLTSSGQIMEGRKWSKLDIVVYISNWK